MTAITPARNLIQVEASEFRAAVSESTLQLAGATMNLISLYQQNTKRFEINGKYGLVSLPFAAIDGIDMMLSNAIVYGVMMFVRQAGSSGTTELDIKYATTTGGSWTSMFSTTPKIQSSAGDFVWIYQDLITNTSSAVANTTAPVLSVTSLTKYYSIRADIITAQGGDARGCGIILYMAPDTP